MADDIVSRLHFYAKDTTDLLGAMAQEAVNEIEKLLSNARKQGLDHITTIGELLDAQAEIEKLRAAGERLAIHLDAHYGLENPHPNDIFLALNEWQKVYPRD